MPVNTPKALHEYAEEINGPIIKVLKQPGVRLLAEEGISPKRASYLQVRMQAAIRGMTTFYHADHEYYRAAINKRLHTRIEKFPTNHEFKNLWVWYDGTIKRPSEEAAELIAELIRKQKNLQSNGE